MKRVGGLFERVITVDTLAEAAWRAARGKRERAEVRGFLSRLESETAELSSSLREGTFRFGVYRAFEIRDPKTRMIHAPPFRDRVVHHALIAVTGPVFERGAIPHSYACRAGRGQHAALRQVRQVLRRDIWFFKADVRKFYDSLDHALLRLMLARRFAERRLLHLWDRLLESYSITPGTGLPIGALTSQYLGNFYLDPVDHWARQTMRTRHYLRYMDDLLFLGSRDEIEAVRQALPAVLDGLGLRLKHGGILNRCSLGVPYLGFVLYPDRVRLNRLGRRRLRRRVKELERGHAKGRVGEAELQARGAALFAHAQFGDDAAWRRVVTSFSRLGETLEPDPRSAGRLLEQRRQELPLGLSQQEQPRQPEPEQRVPGLSGPRHESVRLTDDASSRAPLRGGDETTGKTPPQADIRPGGTEKAGGGAPIQEELPW